MSAETAWDLMRTSLEINVLGELSNKAMTVELPDIHPKDESFSPVDPDELDCMGPKKLLYWVEKLDRAYRVLTHDREEFLEEMQRRLDGLALDLLSVPKDINAELDRFWTEFKK